MAQQNFKKDTSLDDLGFVPDTSDMSMEDLGFVPDEMKTTSQPEPQISQLSAFGRGLGQGATLGFADELTGALEAAGDVAGSKYELGDIIDRYKQRRDEARALNQLAERQYGKTYLGGQVTGGVLSSLVPVGLASKGAAAAAKGASALLNPATLKASIGVGSLAGLGGSEADLTQANLEELKGAGKDILVGGGAGAIGYGALKGLEKFVPPISKAIKESDIVKGYIAGTKGKNIITKAGMQELQNEARESSKEIIPKIIQNVEDSGIQLQRAHEQAAQSGLKINIKNILESQIREIDDDLNKLHPDSQTFKELNQFKDQLVNRLNGKQTIIENVVDIDKSVKKAQDSYLKELQNSRIPEVPTFRTAENGDELQIWADFSKPVGGGLTSDVQNQSKKIATFKLDDFLEKTKARSKAETDLDPLKLQQFRKDLKEQYGSSSGSFMSGGLTPQAARKVTALDNQLKTALNENVSTVVKDYGNILGNYQKAKDALRLIGLESGKFDKRIVDVENLDKLNKLLTKAESGNFGAADDIAKLDTVMDLINETNPELAKEIRDNVLPKYDLVNLAKPEHFSPWVPQSWINATLKIIGKVPANILGQTKRELFGEAPVGQALTSKLPNLFQRNLINPRTEIKDIYQLPAATDTIYKNIDQASIPTNVGQQQLETPGMIPQVIQDLEDQQRIAQIQEIPGVLNPLNPGTLLRQPQLPVLIGGKDKKDYSYLNNAKVLDNKIDAGLQSDQISNDLKTKLREMQDMPDSKKAAASFALQQQNPEYRKLINKLTGE